MFSKGQLQEQINAELTAIEEQFSNLFSSNSELKQFFDSINSAITGGKLTRAKKFVGAVYGSNFQRFEKLNHQQKEVLEAEILRTGAAIELFQTAMLIHDDIIDQDEFRRGAPSLFKVLGSEKAILAGDAVLVAANSAFSKMVVKLSSQGIINAKTAQKLNSTWFEMQQTVLAGQVLDEEFANISIQNLEELSDLEILELDAKAIEIAKLKTASYTTLFPVILGNLIATDGVDLDDKKKKELVEEGVQFQLQNDIDGAEKDRKSRNLSRYFLKEEIERRRKSGVDFEHDSKLAANFEMETGLN